MDTNLKSYVFLYKNLLSAEICDTTVSELQNTNWKPHKFYNPKTNLYEPKSGDRELEIARLSVSTNDIIMDKIWAGLDDYVKNLNFSWFSGWQGYTEVRYNRYLEDKLMAEHCDHIHDIFDGQRKGIPTLTVLGLLNNEFTGGEFVMWGSDIIDLKSGDALIFPSCFLYPHKVQPVLSGSRYTFISWVW